MAQAADRVKETATTTGTGDITLGGTTTGYRTFASAFAIGAQVYYCIAHQTQNEWEVGVGTLTGSTTLRRDTVYASSNSGAAVNFSSGTKDVFVTLPAIQFMDKGRSLALRMGLAGN